MMPNQNNLPVPVEPKRWQGLADREKDFLFQRLNNRIESRASEMTELRKFFVKALVAANATAAAATLAFVESVAKGSGGHDKVIALCGWASLLFVVGFISATVFLAIVIARSRESVVAESEYLNDIINSGQEIDWHTNPRIQRLSPWKFGVGLVFAVLSVGCLLFGIGFILYILIGVIPDLLAAASQIKK
jgi:hypothetical protein